MAKFVYVTVVSKFNNPKPKYINVDQILYFQDSSVLDPNDAKTTIVWLNGASIMFIAQSPSDFKEMVDGE